MGGGWQGRDWDWYNLLYGIGCLGRLSGAGVFAGEIKEMIFWHFSGIFGVPEFCFPDVYVAANAAFCFFISRSRIL